MPWLLVSHVTHVFVHYWQMCQMKNTLLSISPLERNKVVPYCPVKVCELLWNLANWVNCLHEISFMKNEPNLYVTASTNSNVCFPLSLFFPNNDIDICNLILNAEHIDLPHKCEKTLSASLQYKRFGYYKRPTFWWNSITYECVFKVYSSCNPHKIRCIL